MKLPIVINNFGDIAVYDSLRAAEIDLEPIDILNGEYVGYDAEGRSLKISPSGDVAKIELAEAEPNHADELRRVLATWFEKIGLDSERLLNVSLEELITLSLNYKEPF